MKTVFIISSGRIVGHYESVAGSAVVIGGFQEPTADVDGKGDPETEYVTDIGNGPEILSRPSLPELAESPAGTFVASGCPTGMSVAVWDREIEALITTVTETGGNLSLTLADPGPYRLEVAVWPYLPYSLNVEIA